MGNVIAVAISRILGALSLAIVAAAMVSVVTSWSDDDASPSSGASSAADASTTSQAPTFVATSPTGVTPSVDSGPTGVSSTSGTQFPAEPRSAELVFSGDIIPDTQVGRLARHYAQGSSAAHDFGPMFERVAAELTAADLAICHLETTVSTGGTVTGSPNYQAPEQLVEAIAASGWDGCSLASEHAFGHGAVGVADTIEAMAAVGLGHAGTAIDAARRGVAARYDAGGIDVAHLSYTFAVEGDSLPDGEPWWVDIVDPDLIAADARVARDGGADFVVVSLHWGEEYRQEPTADQSVVAQWIAQTGLVDLIIGHHAHVVQPVTRIGDTWVVYGLGNFLSNQTPGCCTVSSEDGAILHVSIADTVAGVAVTGISYTPTWVDRVQMQVMPIATRLLDSGLEAWYRAVMRNSWARTEAAFSALGADQDGVAPIGTLQ